MPQIAHSQNVIEQGKLRITEGSTSKPGSDIVPPLEEDGFESEGIILFKLSDKAKKFIKLEDLKNWINAKEFQFAGDILFTPSSVRIINDAVRIRYNLDYAGPGIQVLTKSVSIDSRTFTFKGTLNFHKKLIVPYTIDVSQEPKFDQDIFGAISVIVSDGEGAEVVVNDPSGFNQKSTIRGGSAIFEKLNEGTYTVTVTKNGYQTETRQINVKPGSTATPVSLTLKKQTLVLAIKSNISGFDILIIDERGQNVYQQFDKSNGLVIDLVPGKYQIKVTKQDYKDDTKSVTMSTQNETVSVYLAKSTQASQPVVQQTKSSKTWVYLLLLGAAGGGAAWYFTQGGGSPSGGGDYGTPPALPDIGGFRR